MYLMMGKNKSERKILYLIDDDMVYRQLLHHLLENEGFTVQSFEDGYLALESLEYRTPDAIICDIEMPILNGIQFFSQYRQSGFYDKSIPFVFISSTELKDKIEEAERLSGNGLIHKSLPIIGVISRLKKVIGQIAKNA